MKLDRRMEVLKAIIEHFVDTAEPVGSNTILVSYRFNVSPATIRNDMASLEKEGLIYQPHTSAGRIPTDLGYRLYVDNISDYQNSLAEAKKAILLAQKQIQLHQAKQYLFDLVQVLSQVTNAVSFATIPGGSRTFYLGLSNIIRQPEFVHNTNHASQVIEVLEKNDNFLKILGNLEIDHTVKLFIGKENLIPEIQSCALTVKKITLQGHSIYLGLLSPTRTDYAFNMAVLEQINSLI